MHEDKYESKSYPSSNDSLIRSRPESFPGGYNGRILRVNLSNNTIISEVLSESFCRKYIGGAGFIAYYLWKELKPGIDALSPDNKLIFALGPVSGLLLPGAARNCVGAKSPLTGGIAKSECGGFWMAELKRAGFDAIIIEGKAPKLVYLWVHDGEAVINNAGHLRGKETKEAQDTIRNELGDDRIHIALIGPGAEKMVRFACITQGLHDVAGRGGLGAVMGSKNLKAIAVRGHKLPPVSDPDTLKMIRQRMVANPHPISKLGTGGNMNVYESEGNLPVRNFREGVFPGVDKISAGAIKETIRVRMEGCFACPIRCKKVVSAKEPYYVDPDYGGPEYETLAALGSNCGIDDVKAIAKANERCNAYSIDTISTGSVIAFAMECYERGLLTKEDTGGIELKFDNVEVMLKLVDLIASRDGIGDLLAEGTARVAEKIGKDSKDFAMHVKGLEPGMHDPRINPSLAMGFMVGASGADHCISILDKAIASETMFKSYRPLGFLDPMPLDDFGPRKVAISRIGHLINTLLDSMVFCVFPGLGPEDITLIIKTVTGWDTSMVELLRAGERIITVMRLFNIREGITSSDDGLPNRFLQPKLTGVVNKVKFNSAVYERARKYYYLLMGWDSDGVPLPEKVEELYIE